MYAEINKLKVCAERKDNVYLDNATASRTGIVLGFAVIQSMLGHSLHKNSPGISAEKEETVD